MLLKNALLLGVRLSYGTTLVGVQAPEARARGRSADGASAAWHVWAKGGLSSHDVEHAALSAADLSAADLAADEADEIARLAAEPDVVSSATIDLSEELAVITKGSLREKMAALQRVSSAGSTDGEGGASSPAVPKPSRNKALAMAAMFEQRSSSADSSRSSAAEAGQAAGNKSAASSAGEAGATKAALDLGALDFKPIKTADYVREKGQVSPLAGGLEGAQ